jgi:integrase
MNFGRNGLLFPDTNGDPLTRASWRRKWLQATRTVGTHQLRFHDLRHTGNTIAAATGASTKELMARMGHSSARAALIYQHATRQRDAAIADAIGAMIEKSTDCR